MKVGYARVSTGEQSTQRQESILEAMGAETVYVDTASGKTPHRPGLAALLAFVRAGDQVVVESISRFARNTKDLLELLDQLERKGVGFVSQKEAIDTATPTGRFMLTVFGAVAELEREYLRERQREGIALAKAAGKYRGRRPIQVDPLRFESVYRRWKAGEVTAVEARKTLGLSANTFYRRVKQYETSGNVGNKS